MANVTWTTPAGSLGIINERDLFSKQLEANSADSTSLTYSKVAGTLPPGIRLTSTGLLQGTPFEVARRSLYTFVIRASDGTNVFDRTFSLQIQGADAPVFTTAAGLIDLSDSTRVGNKWILDGSYVEYQIQATDTDTATGQTLVYDITAGRLPPGLTLSKTGLIKGTVRLTDNELLGVYGGFDNVYSFDTQGYDPLARSTSRSQNFEFTIRVTDGTNFTTQQNSIFVFTADFWRVDNNRITVDQNTYQGYPLRMSLSANRRPVFETDSNLGTYRHDNELVVKIDVVDFDPLQNALEYSISAGSLPPGISIDISSGELYGTLPVQGAVSKEYTFTVRAGRTPTDGAIVYTDKTFTLTVIGDIDIGIAFTTGENIGEVTAGVPCLLNISAESSEANRVLTYSKTSGTLPTGITLSSTGELIGTVDPTEYIGFDDLGTTYDTNTTTFDKKYTFSVEVSDQYQSQASTKEFSLSVKIPYNKEYGNLYGYGFLDNRKNKDDQNLFLSVAQDPNINSSENIFRPDDPEFGVPYNAKMLLVSGLEKQTINTLNNAMKNNHQPKTMYFGNIKTAVAKEGNVTKYEVVYIEMTDNLVNNLGDSISKSIELKQKENAMLGPRVDDLRITTDQELYDVTTDGGLSFSISGSKLRYANPMTADLGYFEQLYPNAVKHMRDNMKNLGEKEFVHLPLWMRTSQSSAGTPLGYKMAVVLAYCKPGKSGLVKKRILDKKIDFKDINFVIDRYTADTTKVDSGSLTTDGSTVSYELNEIVHDEEIKVREDSRELIFGKQFTADNSKSPLYLSADTLLRSADYEPEFSLSHDSDTNKTTITFTNAPSSTSKLRVERKGDKYLVFKKKLKE